MELLILNERFEEIGNIDQFSSLQWNRKYYDVGSFELHCSSSYFPLLEEGTYIFRKDAIELGIIESIEYQTSNGNSSFTVNGRFAESLLNDRCIEKESNFSGKHEKIARQIVQKNCLDGVRKIPYLILGNEAGLGVQTDLQINKAYVGDKLYEFLEEKELSQRIRYDYMTDKLIYEVWQGKDRTDTQQENTWAVFSDDFENISDNSYSKDSSDFKNFVYVIGKNKEDDDPFIVEINQVKNNERRRELFVAASTSWKNDDGTEMDENQYRSKLIQLGTEELDKNKIVEVFDGKIMNQSNLHYKIDYDLGDLVTCINSKLKKMADKRITEIKEIYEDGKVEIEPSFGNDFKTIAQIIRGR